VAAYRSETRKWSRTAVAIGVLFASMPAASRVFLGVWGFHQATGLSIICFTIAIYLYARSLGWKLGLPDGAALLDRAHRLESSGRVPKAISVLTQAIRLDPNLWQAHEYRGNLHARQGEYSEALKDFTEAIRLAPHERHLYVIRARVYSNIGEDISAGQDYETARRLGNA
jgi:Tfp pilus assembly protein PilF